MYPANCISHLNREEENYNEPKMMNTDHKCDCFSGQKWKLRFTFGFSVFSLFVNKNNRILSLKETQQRNV